jgi:hypothetical protein
MQDHGFIVDSSPPGKVRALGAGACGSLARDTAAPVPRRASRVPSSTQDPGRSISAIPQAIVHAQYAHNTPRMCPGAQRS